LEKTTGKSRLQRHKQTLQALTLVILLGTPALLYWAAKAGATGWVVALLGVMAGTMALLTLLT
jgi:dihydrodipicolinate synthase/N-acetylneuraminate lyase